MVAFGFRRYVEPTSITDEEIESLHSHGYRDREISDVVSIVAHNVIHRCVQHRPFTGFALHKCPVV